MFVLAQLIVFVGATEGEPSTPAIRNALAEALGADTKIELTTTVPLPSDELALRLERDRGAIAVATIRWDRDRCTIHLHRKGQARWSDRTLRFNAADTPKERGRAVGFSLSALVPPRAGAPDGRPTADDRVASAAAPSSAAATPPANASSSPPASASSKPLSPPPSNPPSPPPDATSAGASPKAPAIPPSETAPSNGARRGFPWPLEAEVEANVAVGLDGRQTLLGPGVRLWATVLPRVVVVGLGTSWRSSLDATSQVSQTSLSMGATWWSSPRASLRTSASAAARWISVSLAPHETSRSRWVPVIATETLVRTPLANTWWLHGGVGLEVAWGATRLWKSDQQVGQLPLVHLSFALGVAKDW